MSLYVTVSRHAHVALLTTLFLITMPGSALADVDPDLDNNGVVGPRDYRYALLCSFADLAIRPICLQTDINGDGAVDSDDVQAVLQSMGQTFPTPLDALRSYPAPIIATPGAPNFVNSILLADMNEDDTPDLVSTIGFFGFGNSDGVAIRLGVTGYAYAIELGGDTNPRGVEAADINHDGIRDLVVGLGDGSYALLIGAGNGVFDEPVTVPSDLCLGDSLVLADINGDHVSDIVRSSRRSFCVLAGLGHGVFGNPVEYPVGTAHFIADLIVTDIDGDDIADVVTANDNNDYLIDGLSADISIAFGSGDGSFSASTQVTLSGRYRPKSISAGDLDGDGNRDVVTANGARDDIWFLSGNGDGTFGSPVAVSIADDPRDVVVTDFDKDGTEDILAVSRGVVSVIRGDGAGGFEVHQRIEAGGAIALAAGDVGNDGESDLILKNETTVTLLRSDRLGGFRAARRDSVGNQPRNADSADLNGDGLADFVVTNRGSDDVSVLLSVATGGFDPATAIPVGDDPRGVVLADFNRDGRLDLAVAIGGGNSVAFLAGLGGGFFDPPVFYPCGESPQNLSVGDFDNNDTLDLAVPNILPGGNNDTLSILSGAGDGTFAAPVTIPVPPGNPASDSNPGFVLVVDADADGHDDIVTANRGSDNLSLFSGLGDGSFDAPVSLPVLRDAASIDVSSIAAADFDGDGNLDFVVANGSQGSNVDYVSVLLGNGDRTFAAPRFFDIAPDSAPLSAATGDINGDGKIDILTADVRTNTVSLLLGNGDGSFQPRQGFAVGAAPNQLLVTDVDNDSDPDVVTVNMDADSISTLIHP